MEKTSHPHPARAGKVAVIAVHGVGDPGSGGMAQSIASLLVRLRQGNGAGAYTPFTETAVTIETRQVDPGSPFNFRITPIRLAQFLGATPRKKTSHDLTSFIRSQLQGFVLQGDDRTYETVCQSGARVVTPHGERAVDVYEIYWADLMRLGSGFITFFTELYQLMFHLGHLAIKTAGAYVDDPLYGASQRPLGKFYVGAVTVASQYLSTYVFLFNVALVPVALLATWLVGGVSVWQWTLSSLLLGLAGFLAWSGFKNAQNASAAQIRLIAAILIGGAVIFFRHNLEVLVESWFGATPQVHDDLGLIAVSLYLVLSSFIVGGFVIAYDKFTPGSRMAGLLLGLFFWFTFFLRVGGDFYDLAYHPGSFPNGRYAHVTQAILEWLLGLIIFGYFNYLALLGAEVVAIVVGLVELLRSKPADRRRGAFRVFGTVVFGLGLPTVLFSLVTITAWAVYTKAVLPLITTDDFARSFGMALLSCDSQGFLFTVGGAGLALLTALTVLLPSIGAEFCLFARSSQTDASRLARWLNGGGATLAVAMAMLFAGAVLPLATLTPFFHSTPFTFDFGDSFSVLPLLSFVGVSGLTLLALKDDLGKWALALGPILNKILDVDSYFRQFPSDATPKARVFCRYASLLRHVMQQPDVEKIVILSYSQGTVITADLLRFLHDPTVPADPDLFDPLAPQRQFKKDVLLFTMGCPLRQLYSERFPTWYDWARSNAGAAAPTNATPPDEKLLGVRVWSNAYGAGDYIGRALWRGPADPPYTNVPAVSWEVTQPATPLTPAAVVTTKPNHLAREFCIGPFGHIQYFNEPGDAIARELDRLISL